MASGKSLLIAALTVLGLFAATPAASASAAANTIAAPGIPIFQTMDGQGSRCTLGYTARNAEGDRLAVTAGHCGTVGQPVYNAAHRVIGDYVAVQPDDLEKRIYGYAIIRVRPEVALSAWVTSSFAIEGHGQARPGDYVCMFGTTSGMRCSTVATVTVQAGTLTGAISQSGDSGGPLIRMSDHALVGILIGHNAATAETLVEPIAAVITLAAMTQAAGTNFGPVVDDTATQQ
jgi:hypothetical protein